MIGNGLTVTMDVSSATVNSLTILDGNANTSLDFSGTNTLSVAGDITVANTNNNTTKVLNVAGGTLTIGGNLNFNEGAGARVTRVSISTGTMSVGGNITVNASGTATNARVIFTGAGTLNVAGTYPAGTTLTNVVGSTINFNGTAQTVPNYGYNNLTLSGSGVKTLPPFATIAGSLTLSGTASATTAANLAITGSLNVGSNAALATGTNFTLAVTGGTTIDGMLTLAGTGAKTFTGALTINPGGTYTETGVAGITNSNSLTNNGNYIANTGLHTISTNTAKTIGGSNAITIPALSITGTTTLSGVLNIPTSLTTSGTVTNNGSINATAMTVATAAFTNNGTITTPSLTVNNAFTNNGTLNISTILAGTNTLTNAATGVLNFGGATITTTTLTATAAGNVVNYRGAAQTVRATTYSNLILSGSGLKTMASTSIVVNNNLNILSSAQANLTANSGAIYSLAFNGVGQTGIGTWGTTASGATYMNDTYFANTFRLNTVTHNDTKLDPNVSFGVAPTPTYLGGNFSVSATKNNSETPAITYSMVSGPCVLVSGSTFASTGAGTCVVQAYAAPTTSYEAGFATQSITIAKASQELLTVTDNPTRVFQGNTTTLSTIGGSGTGAVSYSIGASTGCTVAVNVVTVNDASGTCTVTATKAADTNFAQATGMLDITMAYYQSEINKQFTPPNIQPGGISTLSITVYNPNAFQLINTAWSDNLIGVQPGIKIATVPNIQNNPVSGGCGGIVTAIAGGTTITLSGGTVPAKVGGTNGQCTVKVDVTSTTASNLVNTIAAGTVTATDASGKLATNTTPASATLAVVTIIPPTVSKSFAANTIYAGATSTLTVNITNQDPSNALTNVSLTDTLPANVVIATPPSPTVTGSGCGGTVANLTATPGAGSLSFGASGGVTIAAGVGRVCTLTVRVTSAVQGSYVDFIPGGAVQDDQGVTNALPAQATLNVQQLNLTKGFVPATIPAGGTSIATITLFNPGAAYSGMNLTDTLPVNMTVFGTPTPSQCGGAISSTSTSVTLTGGVLAAGSPGSPTSCTIIFTVTTPLTLGTQTLTNTIPAGSLIDDQGISNPATVRTGLNITGALSVTKAIVPGTVSVDNPSTVTVTLTNNTASQITGVSMSDVLPVNLVVYGTPTASQCNGGTINATSGSVSLTGGTINALSNCTVIFQVTSTVPNTYVNAIAIGGYCGYVGVTQVCNTAASNNANLVVTAAAVPITGSKSFAPANVAPGTNSVLTINIIAPSDSGLTNVSVTDNLPTGVTIVNPPASTQNAACVGGTRTAVNGAGTFTWTGGSIAAGATCTLTITVRSNTPGSVTNTISTAQVTDNEGRTLNAPLTASLNVSNFTVTKAFYPSIVNANGLSTLTITLDNQNFTRLTNLSLTDNLTGMGNSPNNVVIAPTPNASTTCGGTLTANAGGSLIQLVNASVPAKVGSVDGLCTINVDVQGRGAAGTRTNTIPIANVSASLSGATIYPLAAATNTLTIAPLSITVNKSFDTLTVFGGSAATMRIRLTNPNNAILTGIGFTDTMPTGMYIAAPPNLSTGTCGGTLNGVPGSSTFTYRGGSLAVAPASCDLTLSVTMNVNGNLTNIIPVGAVTTFNQAINPQAAQASLTNLGGVSVHKWFIPASIPRGSISTMTLQIVNISNFPLTNVSLPDTLPTDLVIADFSSVNLCGGSLTADQNTGDILLMGGNVAANSSCTITVHVTNAASVTTPACYTNIIPASAITDNEGQSNTDPAQDTVCILGNPSLSTTPSAGGLVGTTLNDTAILSGGNSPTGTVMFKLYPPSDATCSKAPIYTQVVASAPYQTTPGFVSNTTGIWHWTADYSGDANNSPTSSGCSAEPVTITQSAPSITTNAITTMGTVAVNIPSIGDRVTSMDGAFNPTGSITFTLFSDATCNTAVPGMSGSGSIFGGMASWSTSWTPPAPGTYYWQASYTGDANNSAITSACGGAGEQVTINKATPLLTTTALTGPVAVGSSITDTAHLSGGFGTLGGTISFDVFAPGDSTCSTPIAVTPALSVNGAGDYTSASYTTAAVGTYRWIAHYSGDTNNVAVNTTCNDIGESTAVVKASPVLTTAATGPVTLGNTITDTAHLSGVFGNLSGTISFNVFAPGDTTCSTPIAVTPDLSISGSGDYISAPYTTALTGDYRWIASYSGDTLNNSVSTACNDAGETSTVNNLATPTLTTLASGPVMVGGSIHDTAHLSGGFGTLSGTISFNVYAPGDDTCSTPIAVTPDATVNGTNDYVSGDFTTTAAGTYRWRAFYSGDSNNNAVSTGCYDVGETSIANPMIPSLTTTASGSVTVGGSITDMAHLGGGYGTLSGTISFNVYAPGDITCSTPTAVTPNVIVSGAGDYTSALYTTLTAGTYRWRASYSGDANNAAISTTCNDTDESSVVNQATPTLTTTASGPVTIGGTIHDTANLNGGFSTLGGTISFNVYAPGDTTCNTAIAVDPSVNVNGVGNYSSVDYATVLLGTYRWRAFYSGDVNNAAVSTACNDAGESSTTTQATPNITTTASGPVTVGGIITDTAHLSGGFGTLGGTISFRVYAPGDTLCSTPIAVTPDVPVNGVNDYTSASFTTMATGAYRWRAFYSGDANNIAVSTACNDSGETSTVNLATPTLTTTASGPVTVGDSITDTAHLSSGFGTLGGIISFTIYSPGDIHCFTPTSVIPNRPVNGAGDYISASFATITAGTYRWIAHYLGDANNEAVDTACNDSGEMSVVGKATPGVTTDIHDASHGVVTSVLAGATVHDSATITGLASPAPSGMVDFTFYLSNDCTGSGIAAGTGIPLTSGEAHPSLPQGPLDAGDYSFKAHYNGDTNYVAADSACEALIVGRVSPTVNTQLKLASDNSNLPSSISSGTSVYDTASLTGSYNAGGTVTYKIYSNNSCTTEVTDVTPTVNLVIGGSIPDSTIYLFSSTGNFWYQAEYSGDANNFSATSICTSEPVEVSDSIIGVAKQMVGAPVLVSPGTWDVTFDIFVKNYGSEILTALQVTENLSTTFPVPTTFTVQSVSSSEFTENWSVPAQPTDYNGGINTNLLTGVDTLAVGGQGTIRVIIRIVPASDGPFYNTVNASGLPPSGPRVTDNSTDGTNPDFTAPPCTTPCVNGDNNPNNNTRPTPVVFSTNLFDPPMGIKVVDASNLPILRWTMAWINDTNIVAVNAAVSDPIPLGATFVTGLISSGYPVPLGAPSGSTNLGVDCNTTSSVTTTGLCYFEGPTIANPRGRIVWQGVLGPDLGVTDPSVAVNDISITFDISIAAGISSVQNNATLDSDLNGNGTSTDPGEQNVATASAFWTRASSIPSILPGTGFVPDRLTILPSQSIFYSDLGNLWLEIPRLDVIMPIVGIPLTNGKWDVSWLGDQAGWLNGTAFPTWAGNSVLTAHVFDAYGQPGPFVHLNWMWYGDKVIVHAWGGEYVYEVRQVTQVTPDAISSVIKHEELTWLTLVTCRGYDQASNSYKYRVAVRAVLVEVK